MRHALGVCAVLALLAGCLAPGAGAPAEPAVIVFENVRVLSMTGEPPLEDASVVVEGDRIVSVGPVGGELPPGARVVDGGGRTLMPGLTDMHAHYNNSTDGPLYLVNGVTTVRQPWGTSQSFRRDALAKAGVLAGPNVYASGPIMDGPSGFSPTPLRIANPEQARGAVETQFAAGFMAVKLYESLDPDTYRAAVAAAHARGMQVWTHTPFAMTVDELLELRVDSIEHLSRYEHSLTSDPGAMAAYDPVGHWDLIEEDRIPDLAARTAEAGVWNTPTLHVLSGFLTGLTDRDAFFARPELRYVHPAYLVSWRAFPGPLPLDLAVVLPHMERTIAARREFVKALYDAGAPLLVGTDAPNPFTMPGYSIHDELAEMSLAGIPNEALLRMATADAARFLRREGEFGVIAPGARADLIVVDGDPLADLGALREPVYVMVDGHLRDRAELLGDLEEIAAQYERDGESLAGAFADAEPR